MTPIGFSLLIAGLSLIGLYAAIFMQRKADRFARGLEVEPSVVQLPRARLLGAPNSAFGIAYYASMFVAAWLLNVAVVYYAALAAAILAAAVSVFLAHSLLFRTRMPCPYCWTGHIVNWSLLALVVAARPVFLSLSR